MWRFYPKSFPMLILAGFSLAVLPLIFALINNAVSIHELATKSQRAVFNAVQATQNSRLLIEQITGMERSARQYSILAEPQTVQRVSSTAPGLRRHVKRMRSLTAATRADARPQSAGAGRERDLRQRGRSAQRPTPDAVGRALPGRWAPGALAGRHRREHVGREIAAMQTLSGEVHNFIYWQLVGAGPGGAVPGDRRDHPDPRPIRQIEAALNRLGEGDFRIRVGFGPARPGGAGAPARLGALASDRTRGAEDTLHAPGLARAEDTPFGDPRGRRADGRWRGRSAVAASARGGADPAAKHTAAAATDRRLAKLPHCPVPEVGTATSRRWIWRR